MTKAQIYQENWRKKNPWRRAYDSSKVRCKNKYNKYGREFNMTIDDFKCLWFRDKAYLMKRPSIDRKDNEKGYVKENCRYIEHSENCSKEKKKPCKQLTLEGKLVRTYYSQAEASRFTNIHLSNINSYIRGKDIAPPGGYKWTDA